VLPGIELRNFLLATTKESLSILKAKLMLFVKELFDPNRIRETSLQRTFREAALSPNI
jgi:hypothetical protein